MLPVEQPFKIYTGLDGKPLNNGYVYFGQPNQDPISKPVEVYWDAAGTQPAFQPLRTMNGYILRAGTPANVFTDSVYSELVFDSKQRQVFYARDSTDFSISQAVKALLDGLAQPGGAGGIGTQGPISGEVFRLLNDVLNDVVHVNRFGGDLKLALQKVPEYTTIVLDAKPYNIAGLYSHDFNFGAGPFNGNTKRGIRLVGAGMPRVAPSGRYLEGGTIIQGTLFNLAPDFEVYDLGVDCGQQVIDTLYGDQFAEVFVPGANTSFPVPQDTIKGFKCNNVIALGAVPDPNRDVTFKHVMLFENLEGAKVGHIEAVGGWHTFVTKAVDLKCSSLVARGGMGDAININANAANRCQQNQFGSIHVDSWMYNGVEQKAGTTLFYSDSSEAPYITKFKCASFIARNLRDGVDVIKNDGNKFVTDVWFGNVDIDMGLSKACAVRIGYALGQVQRFIIDSHNIVTGGRAFEIGANALDVHIGSGVQTFLADATIALMTFDSERYTHGDIRMSIEAAQSGQYLILRNKGDVNQSRFLLSGGFNPGIKKLLSSTGGGFTMSGNMGNAGGPVFAFVGASYAPYEVRLSGVGTMKASGAGLNIGTVLPPPLVTMRLVVPVQTIQGAFVTRTMEITQGSGATLMLDNMTAGEYLFFDGISFSPVTR